MSKFHEVLRIFILDSEKFLAKALKDVKLSSSGAGKDRRSLLQQIQSIREDFVQLDLGQPQGKPELYQKEVISRKESTASDCSQSEATFSRHLIKVKDRAKAVKFASKSGKKWGVLRESTLLVYDKQSSKTPTASIDVTGSTATLLDENKSQLVFQISTAENEQYYFATLSPDDLLNLNLNLVKKAVPAEPKLPVSAVTELPDQSECEVQQYFYGIGTPTSQSTTTPARTTSTSPENIYEIGDEEADNKFPPSPPKISPFVGRRPPSLPTAEEEEELYEAFNDEEDVVSELSTNSGGSKTQRPPIAGRPPPPPIPTSEKEAEEEEEELYAGIAGDDLEEEEIYDEACSPLVIEEELYDDVMNLAVTNSRDSTVSTTLPDGRMNPFSKLYYTKTPYTSRATHELSVQQADQLYLLDRPASEAEGWCVGKLGGRVGLVPREHVYPAYQEVEGLQRGSVLSRK